MRWFHKCLGQELIHQTMGAQVKGIASTFLDYRGGGEAFILSS